MSVDEAPTVGLWERREAEGAKQHDAFRVFRDLGAQRALEPVAMSTGVALRSIKRWSSRYDWVERAQAWDDECHRVEDRERLEAIRAMHKNHQRAGRAAMRTALLALERIDPSRIPASAAARLLELGARLERQTLTVSVEDLQGLDDDTGEVIDDPWERIARELDPRRAAS